MTGNPEAHTNVSWNGHGHMPVGPHHGVDPELTSDAAVPRQSPSAASEFPSDTTPTAEWKTKEIDRLARWYLASARNAVRVIAPNFRTVADPDGPPPAEPLTFDTAHAALAWFEQERPNLLSTLHATADHKLYDLTWRLPVTAGPLFELHSHSHEERESLLLGLRASRALDHRHGQARTLLSLADTEWLLHETEQALGYYASALDIAREVGDSWTEGFALDQLGSLRWQRDRDSEAPALIRQAIEAFRAAGERRGEGMALLSLADHKRSLGNPDTALQHCDTAFAIFTDIADTWTIAWARCFRADALASAGRHNEAIDEYQTALPVFTDLADSDTEAIARTGLGRAHAALDETDQARTHLGAALDLLRSVDDPRADEVQAELAQLS